MANFIIETDLGHDPDDLFCLCHLIEAGHTIRAIGLVPGSPEQVALACGLREHLQLNCEIGQGKPQAKPEHLGIHTSLAKKYNWLKGSSDGSNAEVFRRVLNQEPAVDLLVIGPAPGLGQVAKFCYGSMTFQGGFLPYALYRPTINVAKLEGYDSVGTFNFNGDRQAVLSLLEAPLHKRQFCGKNVCHSIVLDKSLTECMAKPRHTAGEVYLEAVKLYFDHHEIKKMHDPTALVCHLHPEVATWFRGRPAKLKNGWTTVPDADGDFILADVNRDVLWEHILERT